MFEDEGETLVSYGEAINCISHDWIKGKPMPARILGSLAVVNIVLV